MNAKGFETISVSVKTESKELFLSLFDQSGLMSKSEFFTLMVDKYSQSLLPAPDPDEISLNGPEAGKQKLVLFLNEVQNFAISYPFENFPDFIDLANEQLAEMISKKDFWNGQPKFPDFFITYDEERGPEFNKAAFMINIFMACIAKKMINDVVPFNQVQAKGLKQ